MTFYVKREDLSSPFYGGNKVRTLQHQLGSFEAWRENGHPTSRLAAIGSMGTNMCVAAKVHSRRLGLSVDASLIMPDAPDIDNSLNFMSMLSFKEGKVFPVTEKGAGIRSYFSAIAPFSSDKTFAPGGNNIAGVIGQCSAMLELADQIAAGECDDIDEIYVAIGSSCTVSGLLLGYVLARKHLKLNAFLSPKFKIVGVPIHDGLLGLEMKLGLYSSSFFTFFTGSIAHNIQNVCSFLRDEVKIDITDAAWEAQRTHLEIVTDAALVGRYGAHSSLSKVAASKHDEDAVVTGRMPDWVAKVVGVDSSSSAGEKERFSKLWLCGHFASKPYAVLMARLQSGEKAGKKLLFWQTKSAVQPRAGEVDEWQILQDIIATQPPIKSYLQEGNRSVSVHRNVDVLGGNYRHIMDDVFVNKPPIDLK